MQKFSKTGITQRSLIYINSSRGYLNMKGLLEKNKKVRKKFDSTVIPVNNSLLRYIKKDNKISIHEQAGGEYEKLGYRTSNSRSSIQLDKNLIGIDFRMVNNNVIKFNREHFSPEKRVETPVIETIVEAAKFNSSCGNIKPTIQNKKDNNNNLVPSFDFIDNPLKNKRSNSIIVVPEKAIDNVLKSLRDDQTINRSETAKPKAKTSIENDVFSVDKSFFNNNNVCDTSFSNNNNNKVDASLNFANMSPNHKSKDSPNCIKSLDDMLHNPTFFEEVQSVKSSKFKPTTNSEEKFIGASDISSITYMNDTTTNRSMDLSTILLNNTQIVEEDKFNPDIIRKKIRGAILVNLNNIRKKEYY
jgi:hypothetical protein